MSERSARQWPDFLSVVLLALLLWISLFCGWRALMFCCASVFSITCAITAPLALTADLHQTARVWHFYAWPTPWSWMPWGALFLP
ncbi:hypothetical protein MJM83_32235, partial [Salmonella enterica subsp. enterica serovar Montevideo]|nr:hypothetical protein [Salmonella enterica subsp. enterica serovar Montevideo]